MYLLISHPSSRSAHFYINHVSPPFLFTLKTPLITILLLLVHYVCIISDPSMATAQVVSATTVLHEEKLEEKPVQTTEEDVKNAGDQEAIETAPQPQEDQLPKEPVDTTVEPVATEPDVAAPEPKAEPETETELEPVPEPEAVAADVENKMVLEEEEDKVIPVDQPAKVAPEPCVEEEAKETEEAKTVETETEPAEVSKAEVETEPEEKLAQEKEGGTGTAGAADE